MRAKTLVDTIFHGYYDMHGSTQEHNNPSSLATIPILIQNQTHN